MLYKTSSIFFLSDQFLFTYICLITYIIAANFWSDIGVHIQEMFENKVNFSYSFNIYSYCQIIGLF